MTVGAVFNAFKTPTGITPRKIARRDLSLLVIILLIAAALRFAYPEVFAYQQDQADLAALAQDMVDGKSFPLLGIPSSARVPNSPMTVYVIALPYLISDSPVVATLYVAALNVIGVSLLWLLAYRYFSVAVAVIAALAYAVSPWAVGYSRSIWAQDYHTPFFLLSVLFGLLGFVEGKRWAQALCLPILFIAMQIHFAAWLLFPVYLWLLWIGRSRVSKRTLVVSIALTALTLLPFILGIGQFFEQAAGVGGALQAQTRDLNLRNLIKPYGQTVWLVTGLGVEQYIARENAVDLMASIGLPVIFWAVLGLFGAIGVLGLWLHFPRALAVLVLLWAFLPVLVFTVPIIDVFPHYFVPCIPAFMLLIGIGALTIMGWLPDKVRRKRLVWGILGVVFATQSWFVLRTTEYVNRNYTPTQFGFGTPIHYLYPARDVLQEYRDVVIVGTGEWTDISGTGSRVWSSLLRDTARCVRDITPAQNMIVIPENSFAVAFAPRMPEIPVLDAVYRGNEPIVIPLREGEGEYQIYEFSESPTWTGPDLTLVTAELDSGAALTGYHLEGNILTLEWKLPGATTSQNDLRIAYVDAKGDVLGEQRTLFWPGMNWCAEDRLLTWTEITAPAEAQSVQVSLQKPGQTDSTAFVNIPY